ncbi:unnamed protein product, partial [Oppiella nova]
MNPYKRFQRPGVKGGTMDDPLYINVSLDMSSLASIDDLNSEYSLVLTMDLEWYDEYIGSHFVCSDEDIPVVLSMEPGQHSRIWTPKLGVPGVKEPGSAEFNSQNVIAFKLGTNGYIFIRSRLQLKLFCQLYFENYPFDSQKCSVKLQVRGLPDENVWLRWREVDAFRNAERFHMSGFYLIGYELLNDSVQVVDLFEDDRVSRVTVTLHMQREWHHFILDVFLPSGLFVMMSWLSFWLEISAAPARVTLEFAIVSYLYRSDKNRRQRAKTLSALSLASLASSTDPLISKYLDVTEMTKTKDKMVPNLSDNLRFNGEPITTTCMFNKPSKGRRQSLLKRFLKIKCPNDLAEYIDRKSRS